MAADNLIQRLETRQQLIQSFSFVIAVIVCILLTVGFAGSSIFGDRQSCKTELEEKINPNDAPVASLVRLPGIGVGRAGAIIAYRENFSRSDSNTPAFETIEDLEKVKGIGPKTAGNISEWLKFE